MPSLFARGHWWTSTLQRGVLRGAWSDGRRRRFHSSRSLPLFAASAESGSRFGDQPSGGPAVHGGGREGIESPLVQGHLVRLGEGQAGGEGFDLDDATVQEPETGEREGAVAGCG